MQGKQRGASGADSATAHALLYSTDGSAPQELYARFQLDEGEASGADLRGVDTASFNDMHGVTAEPSRYASGAMHVVGPTEAHPNNAFLPGRQLPGPANPWPPAQVHGNAMVAQPGQQMARPQAAPLPPLPLALSKQPPVSKNAGVNNSSTSSGSGGSGSGSGSNSVAQHARMAGVRPAVPPSMSHTAPTVSPTNQQHVRPRETTPGNPFNPPPPSPAQPQTWAVPPPPPFAPPQVLVPPVHASTPQPAYSQSQQQGPPPPYTAHVAATVHPGEQAPPSPMASAGPGPPPSFAPPAMPGQLGAPADPSQVQAAAAAATAHARREAKAIRQQGMAMMQNLPPNVQGLLRDAARMYCELADQRPAVQQTPVRPPAGSPMQAPIPPPCPQPPYPQPTSSQPPYPAPAYQHPQLPYAQHQFPLPQSPAAHTPRSPHPAASRLPAWPSRQPHAPSPQQQPKAQHQHQSQPQQQHHYQHYEQQYQASMPVQQQQQEQQQQQQEGVNTHYAQHQIPGQQMQPQGQQEAS